MTSALERLVRGAAGAGLLAAMAAGCHKAPAAAEPAAPAAAAHAPVVVPSPTPVNDTVTFVREGALWLEHSNGNAQRLLALPDRDEDFWFPAVDPDGSGIVAWLSKGDGTQDLAHVDAAGKITRLTDTGNPAAPAMKDLDLHNAPSFSPDGSRIVYSFNGDLWIVDSDGLNAQTLVNDGSSWAPAWSPDGKRIAYVNGADGHRDLWVTGVDTRDSVQLTGFAGYTVGGPRWSPDGQHLLLTRVHGDESDIVEVPSVADSPATDADLLTKDHLSVTAAFDPLGGGGIVFSSARVDGGDWNLYTSDATASRIVEITQDGGLSPDWSKLPLASFGQAVASPTPAAAPISVPKSPAAAPAPLTRSAQAATRPAPKKKRHKRAAPKSLSATAQAGATTNTAKAAPSAATGTAKAAVAAASAAPKGPAAQPSTVRLRLKASFDDQDKMDAQTEAGLKLLAPRVKLCAGYTLDVIGPLDESDLNGLYFSDDSRSQARAQQIGSELAKLAGFPAEKVKSEPYSPPASGGEPMSVLIYVEMR